MLKFIKQFFCRHEKFESFEGFVSDEENGIHRIVCAVCKHCLYVKHLDTTIMSKEQNKEMVQYWDSFNRADPEKVKLLKSVVENSLTHYDINTTGAEYYNEKH